MTEIRTSNISDIDIIPFVALKDNYVYLLHRRQSRRCLVVDPSDAGTVVTELEKRNLNLELILNTHHHHDHVGGNGALVARYHIPVYCSEPDLPRIANAQRGLSAGEAFQFDGIEIKILAIPGHTLGQLAFYVPLAKAVFVGDTLFALGCGRLFEGSAEQMWSSLRTLMTLPGETRIFFGHEYTNVNGAFAASLEPANQGVQERVTAASRALNTFGFVPAPTLKEERTLNPFLRAGDQDYKNKLGLSEASDLQVFTHLRQLRDGFQFTA